MIHRVAASTKPVTLLDMQILWPQPETLDQTLWGIRHSGAGPSTNGPYRLRSLGLMVGLF